MARRCLGCLDELYRHGLLPTGAPNIGGSIVTAGGLVFIGATNDSRFRAFDKDNGKEIWVTKLPASALRHTHDLRGQEDGQAVRGDRRRRREQVQQYVLGFAGGALVAVALFSAEPVSFSHKRHAPLKLQCAYCHAGCTEIEFAGFPSAEVCSTCHKRDGDGRAGIPGSVIDNIPSKRVTSCLDYVFFSHATHGTAKITCDGCHGKVYEMDTVRLNLAHLHAGVH